MNASNTLFRQHLIHSAVIVFQLMILNLYAQECYTPPEDIIAWWPLNETAGNIANDVVNGFNGNYIGNPAQITGYVNGALEFNGNDDYVVTTDNPVLNPTEQITVTAWIYPTTEVPIWDHNRVRNPIVKKIGIGDVIQNGYALEFLGNQVIFWIYQEGGFRFAPPSVYVPLNQWTHVTGVYDGQIAKFYINGGLYCYSDPHPGGIGISTNPLFIGGDPMNTSNVFAGNIDEVAVFNRALSGAEINALYSAGEYGMCNIFNINEPPVADAGIDQTKLRNEIVQLDGSASADPDNNNPLSFSWSIVQKPVGSLIELSNPEIVNPTFIIDEFGDYFVQLIVTDAEGLESEPDQVKISTVNSKPIADAGHDQAIAIIGTIVQLDGSQSWDDDGDELSYSWSITSFPQGSESSIDNPTQVNPAFIPDIFGTYEICLVVSDEWDSSEPDFVVISFENIKPVADAGDNLSCIAGDVLNLDGSGSYDDNGNQLSYNWQIISKPAESNAYFSDNTAMGPQFYTDMPGNYIVSLVVNDGQINSDPSTITIAAVSALDITKEKLIDVSTAISIMPKNVFKNDNMANAITNKINSVLLNIDNERYSEAYDKIQNDILRKTDGCADTGNPDKNDWIKDCGSQEIIYSDLMEILEYLNDLLE